MVRILGLANAQAPPVLFLYLREIWAGGQLRRSKRKIGEILYSVGGQAKVIGEDIKGLCFCFVPITTASGKLNFIMCEQKVYIKDRNMH